MSQQYQLPAHLLNRQSKTVGQTLQNNLGKNNPPHLSIEGGRFTLVDAVGNEQLVQTFDPQLGAYIDINIIDVNDHVSKVFWGEGNTYNPQATSYLPPLCYSDNGIGPSRNSAEPQAPTCTQCPHSVWGSATSKVSGKGIKACSDTQKLAFTTAGHNTVFLLRIPPNSLKNMGLYQGGFSGTPIDISDVITRVSFVPGVMGTLQFQAVGYIDEATAAQRESALSAKATDSLIGRGDAVHPGAATLTGPAGNGQAALPAPGQQVGAAAPYGQQQPVTQQPGQQYQSALQQAPIGQPAGSPPFVMPRQPAPAAAPVQQQAGPAFANPAGGVSGQTPGPQPATRRRGRPPAQQAQAAPPQATQAPFPTSQPPQQGQAVPAGPGAQFGIVPGVAPNAELAAALGGLFPQQ